MIAILYTYIIIGLILFASYTMAFSIDDETLKNEGLDAFITLKNSLERYDMIGEGGNKRFEIMLTIIFCWPMVFFEK